MTGNNIRQQLKKLTDGEKVKRFDKGIYYLPKKSIFKSGSKPTLEKVLEYKYLRDNDRRCGYIRNVADTTNATWRKCSLDAEFYYR